MSEEIPDVVKALSMQAGICRSMGSALNGDLMDRAAADWLAGGPVKALLAPWADLATKAQFEAAVPLRLWRRPISSSTPRRSGRRSIRP